MLPQKLCHFIIDHDPDEADIKNLAYWQQVVKVEAARVQSVLEYWLANPLNLRRYQPNTAVTGATAGGVPEWQALILQMENLGDCYD